MNFLSRLRGQMTGEHDHRAYPSVRDQWIIAVLSLWCISGLFVGGWTYGYTPIPETFLSAWLSLFVSGYIALTVGLLLMTWRNKKALSIGWRQAIPVGYECIALGAAVVFVGVACDIAFHTISGTAAQTLQDTLLNPTHLLIIAGMAMMMGGNLIAWWQVASSVDDRPKLIDQLPMILSLAFILFLCTFVTWCFHPVMEINGNSSSTHVSTVKALITAGYIVQTVLMLVVLLIILRRAKPALGACTIVLTLPATLILFMLPNNGIVHIVPTVFAGVIADLLASYVYPLPENRSLLRLFAFAVPASFCAASWLIMPTQGVALLSIPQSIGISMMAGFTGVLLSIIASPFAGEHR